MKSCPVCNRTFDDTLTFCLVDGSILSAPFDPSSSRDQQVASDSAPPTLNYDRQASAEVSLPRTTNSSREPLKTVPSANPPNVKEDSAPSPTVYSPPAPAMKTIAVPPPEVGFGAYQPGLKPAEPSGDSPGRSKNAKLLVVLIGIVVVAVLIFVGVRFLQRKQTNTPSSTSAKATDTKSAPTGPLYTELLNGAQLQMVQIPAGSFMMGSPISEAGRDQDEAPQSEVKLQGFYIGKYEVTQAQYKAVTGTNPSNFKGDDLPVDSVSWDDAVEYCRKLSQLTRRNYRLPTEAEWEYAARSGSTGAYAGNVDSMAWYDADSGRQTHSVGQKQANAFGLYDMNGNVWEWCQSKYKPYPYNAADGRENLHEKDVRALRGGSWKSAARGCRSAYRRRVIPEPRECGFRVVLITS